MNNFSEKVSFIWGVADLLRGDYKQSEYGRVILPFLVLRRLDQVLAPTRGAVWSADEEIQLAAKANDKANFGHVFIPAFKDALVDHHAENGQFVDLVFRDEEVMNLLNALMMDRVYGRLTVRDDAAAGGDGEEQVVPCRRVPIEEVSPFKNCVPAIDLKVAAGGFSPGQVVEPGRYEWVALDGRVSPSPDIFVAQVTGESMNRRIPNGAWCVWRLNPTGTRQGKVVLAQHRDIQGPEHGGQYTVKVYESEKEGTEDGGWRHSRVILKPDSTDPAFQPMVFESSGEIELKIIAELVEVLG